MDIKTIYTDSHLILIEKQGGLLAVPGRGPDKQDCVVNRVKCIFPDIIKQPAVHRLDMDTSGLMILARTKNAHKNLSRQFQEHKVLKKYYALLSGVIAHKQGEINLPFRLDPDNRPHQIYDPVHGKWGETKWRRVSIEDSWTRIEFTPKTGRTHQLRLHSAHSKGLGYPIVGDRLYGSGKIGDQLMLHASYLCVKHPEHGTKMEFESKVPF